MYNPPAFAEKRQEELEAIMRAASLPVLVSPARGGGLLATHLPLLFQAPDRLIGHVAKGNFHWRDFDPDQESLAIFVAEDGYVSPSWYATKQETGRVVPTWNYSIVHATGKLSIVEEPAPLLEIVSALTNRYEQGRAHPWAVADAPDDYIAAQLKGIVGLVLTITRLEGKAKQSQNRSLADRHGVVAGSAEENPALSAAVKRRL
ncbi:MAG: FMN-binding negative transcriptional regulator [Rhodospirillales bacterium]|nr:FMN-binding negative transcriptional regulator [Rhodospirillales bacterium]MDE2389975.1 FMN-binding negative transcriptional regulator [Rhodospirillales bacterium]